MKNILITLVVLATTLSADFIKVEAGGGMWNQTSKGFIEYTNDTITAKNESQKKYLLNSYAWMYVKHFLPLIPNLRIEYSNIKDKSLLTSTGKILGLDAKVTNLPTTLELTQIEMIPYYNLLDNTFWVTIDVGVDLKLINYIASSTGEAEVDISGASITTATNLSAYNSKGILLVPLLYLRTRVQIPFTGIGIEASKKLITYGKTSLSDLNIKLDYTLNFIPVIQPGIEIGYRLMSIKASIKDTGTIDYTFSGIYAGMMLRF